VFRTSLASLAIISNDPLSDTLTDSINWLDGEQRADGSWGNNVLDSAITLYAAYSGFTPTCGDNICRSEDGEDSSSCPADCAISTGVSGSQDLEICNDNFDNDGDSYTDCEDIDCISDPVCAVDLEICDDFIDNDGDSFVDCDDLDCSSDSACTVSDVTVVDDEKEEGSSALFWIVLIVIILLIGGLLFYLWKKGFFKRSKKRERPAPIPPLILPRRAPPRRAVVRAKPKKKKEDELERSIREARKLMGLK